MVDTENLQKKLEEKMRSTLKDELICYLDSGPKTNTEETDTEENKIRNIVFIAFDEAHSLTDLKDGSERSPFLELRWALRKMEKLPCFAFFLSTTGKILDLAPPKYADASMRTNMEGLRPSLPFSDLGFDHLMRNHKIFEKFKTIHDVTSTACVVRMGRPL